MDMAYPSEDNTYSFIEAVLFKNKESINTLSGCALQTLNTIEKM